MKLHLIVLPLSVALAFSGLALVWTVRGAKPSDLGVDMSQPRHLVTPQMEIETASMANRTAPAFSTADSYGKAVKIGQGNSEKPQFVLFIKDGCPCSVDAQPLFNRLGKKYAQSVEFVGVIDVAAEKAKKYSTQFQVPFPVLPDDKLEIIHGYQAKAAVYSALVAKNGHIVKMWPGYSADMLREMNLDLAKASGQKETPFDPQYAPTKKAAGCAFDL